MKLLILFIFLLTSCSKDKLEECKNQIDEYDYQVEQLKSRISELESRSCDDECNQRNNQ